MRKTEEKQDIADQKLIDQAFKELTECYLASKHRKKIDIIKRAFNFAREAHKGVKRRSGEPYITHPLAVALIVCKEIGLGSTSICSALLHDVVEDTEYTVEDIKNLFGEKIAQIVEGLTKISGGIFGDKASAQAENFKKLLLTMSNDIRVVLIKMADRLHNMRTLGSMLPSKQLKIAGETLYIYAPLANRLGLNKIKTELEDLSFKYEHPDKYRMINEKLSATAAYRDKLFKSFTLPIREALDKDNISYHISQRIKSPYSIWRKISTKNLDFEDIFDILAVRIVFDPKDRKKEITESFEIYATISDIYKIHPDRFRDWITHPKANSYQALHITAMSHTGQWIEVQIRSKRMNDVAEQGLAAHWKYKEKEFGKEEGELERWLKTIREILDHPEPNAMDFLDTIKLNLYASEIYVFTPKGDLKRMPKHSTVLDFAFDIHTAIGTHCIGAKVNHKLEPLDYVLKSGDQIEILTSKSPRVQPEWIRYVTSAKAVSKLTSYIKKQEKALRDQGKQMIRDFFEMESTSSIQSLIDNICNFHNLDSHKDLYIAIATGRIELNEEYKKQLQAHQTKGGGWRKYIPFITSSQKECIIPTTPPLTNKKIDTKKIVKLKTKDDKANYVTAECCKPIPGEDVMGFINNKNQIIIHKRECPVAMKLKASSGNKIVAAEWDMNSTLSFLIAIEIKGVDSIGLLNEITQVISQQMNVNIRKLNIESKGGIFIGELEVYVYNINNVTNLCNTLRKIENVTSVNRIDLIKKK
jgi:GTP pyrophosphokinase